VLTPDEIEDLNQKRYQDLCTVAQISIDKDQDPKDYFWKLFNVKLSYLKKYGVGKRVLDIGCGSGDYLFEINGMIAQGYGIDYTDKAIGAANDKKETIGASNIQFIKANAKNLPFADGTFDLVYSFSALAYIPKLEEVIKEVSRVLNKGGVAVLEIGNWRSLNTIVCQAHPELPVTCHVKISGMNKWASDAQLTITDRRAFGILPFWGRKPGWLRPLLHERWKKLFQIEINGKMLDEWVSNFFLFKPFVYRHFIFLKKE